MGHRLLALVAVIGLSARPAVADEELCRHPDRVIERLIELGYQPLGGGEDDFGNKVQLFVRASNGDWSMWYVSEKTGMLCPVNGGKGWRWRGVPPEAPES